MSSPFIFPQMQLTIRPKAMLTSLQSPIELTEKYVRDLIPMDGRALDGGGESSDGEGAREAGSN